MQPLATAAQMKEMDRIAIEERNIPSLDLMEWAAGAVAKAVRVRLEQQRRPKGAHSTGLVLSVKEKEDPTPEERAQQEHLRALMEEYNRKETVRVAPFTG